MDKRRELRTIWNSNGIFTGSGYANFQRDLLSRLSKDGWPIAHIAFWGLEGSPVYLKDYPDIKIYPKMNDAWGADGMVHHAKDFKADVVFAMQDVWPLNEEFLKQIKTFIPYTPIDKAPVPPGVLNKLRYANRIVTFSRFGQKELEKKGFTSTLIVEGTDTNIFKPMDKAQARKELGLPQDIFLFVMVAANKENPPRKGFQEALEAFEMFNDKHPQSGILFQIQQPGPGGFPIKGFADHLGIADKMIFTQDYTAIWGGGSQFINKLYNASDALLHPSQTEGFGLTVIEAAATGIPAIVNNCTSMPEMIVDGKTGLICEHDKPRWTNDNSWVYPANVKSLYLKMEEMFMMVSNKRITLAQDCRDHIVKNYNIDTLFKEKWTPFMESLQKELLPLTKEEKSNILNQVPK